MKVAILTNILPKYREGFYDQLFNFTDIDVTVFCQSEIKKSHIKTVHEKYQEKIVIVNYWSSNQEKIIFHFLPFTRILREFDLVFIDGNPRNISHFLLATWMELRKKKVVLWSMLHSFRNNKTTENLRIRWMRMFRFHFLYNDADLENLARNGIYPIIAKAMNNGINQGKVEECINQWDTKMLNKWQIKHGLKPQARLISLGRLMNSKYKDMLPALILVKKAIPDVIWLVIGDGPDKEFLEKSALELNLSAEVIFAGALFDELEMTPWFLSADVFVHPTAIGLSIMHASAFGLPTITHNNFSEHGPEIIAFEENKNGLSYEEGNIQDLANKIISLVNDKPRRLEMGNYAKNLVKTKFNTNVMANRFIEMVNAVSNFN